MKKKKLVKRVLSMILALTLVVTSIQFTASPAKEAEAATGEMGENENLSNKHIADSNVLAFYKILANAQRNLERQNPTEEEAQAVIDQMSEMNAGEILEQYGSQSEYTKDVLGTYLTNYPGKIDFAGVEVSNIEGIGWARSATEFDLSTISLTEIPAGEFASCGRMTKIILPSGVTKIGESAFLNCNQLETLKTETGTDAAIDLTGVREIGASAFSGCTALTAVKFSEEVTTPELKIGNSAFMSCSSLKEIKLPIKTADNLGANAFENCSRLTKVGLRDELTYLSNGLFKGAGMGTKYYVIGQEDAATNQLPSKLTYIGDYCFDGAKIDDMDLSGLSQLRTIKSYAFSTARVGTMILPEGLRTIESLAFTETYLAPIEIPDSCTQFGERVFAGSYLTGITLPAGLTEIPDKTFERCKYLRGSDITIKEGSRLESIGELAFSECERLGDTSFLNGLKNLTTIGTEAFSNCYVYEKSSTDGNPLRDSYGEFLIADGLEEVTIPDCVTQMGTSVFSGNYALRSVELGKGIAEIPEKAFYVSSAAGGSRLEKVMVSNNLKNIGKNAFANQNKLDAIGYTDGSETKIESGTVQFADGLLSIEDNAFAGCAAQKTMSVTGVKSYVLKTNVSTEAAAGKSEFLIYDYEEADKADDYCRSVFVSESDLIPTSSLNETVYKDGKLTETGKETYKELNIIAKKIYVNPGKKAENPTDTIKTELKVYGTYAKETNIEAYKTRIYAGQDHLFYDTGTWSVRPLDSFYVSNDAVSVNASASNTEPCWTQAVTSSAVTNVGIANSNSQSMTLNYTFGIRNVVLPESLLGDNLGAGVFKDCFNLEKVILPEGLTEIKNDTFSGAGKEVPDFAGSDKYHDYYGLKEIVIPEAGLKKIGDKAFYNCSNLRFTIISTSALGSSLESIGASAFEGCYSLTTMKFPKSLKTIERNAFANCAVLERNDETKKSITYNESTYTCYANYKEYGTKETKSGLYKVDFSAASGLEKIGNSAFKQTNLTSVEFVKSPLTQVPDGLFEQCSYLTNVIFHDGTESMGTNVFRDTISLSTVRIPALAVLKENTFSGAFGNFAKLPSSEPSLTLSYPQDEEMVVPVGSTLRLPINSFNSDVQNGDIKVALVQDGAETDILGEDNKVDGIWAEFKTDKEPYSIVLHGEQKMTTPVTVKVEGAVAFQHANSGTYWMSSQTFTTKVTVDEVPTETVSISASQDSTVKNNPSMYTESADRKNLYVPVKSVAAVNGIKLTASINPAETTDEVTWESDNPGVIEVGDAVYEKGSGTASAVVRVKEFGDAKITVHSGKKTDVLYVTGQIPVAASGGLTCTTSGSILDTTLKGNSSSNPYALSIGDTDKINVTVKYPGGSGYDESQLNAYGEKTIIESSDDSVITVQPDGTFRAVGEGTAVVTVKGQASGTKVQFYFEVTDGANYTPYSVTVTGATEVNIGESISLSAAVAPSKCSQDVVWSVVSGQKNASVDANGTVTGLAKGDAVIVAASAVKDTVKSTQFRVTVKAPVKELKVLDGDISLEAGKTMTISKTTRPTDTRGFYVSPVDTTDSIEWKSTNEGVVSVTRSSTQSVSFKAVSVGTANIVGTASSGVSVSVNVNVFQKTNSITVDKEVTLNVGKTHQLNPQKVPATSNENLTFTYTSSNAKIAMVDANGVIRAVAPGSAVISVKSNTGKTASCFVTVKQPASKITLRMNRPSVKKIYLAKGQTVTLNAKMAPENTTDKLTYQSSKAKVAAVAANGMVTAKKKGTAKITVKADSGKKVTVTVIVSRKQVKAKKVKIKAPKSMKRKKTIKLSVSLSPGKSTDTLSYSINKPKLAKVDAYGYVTALKKKGKIKVTVTASSGKKAVKTIKIR